MFWEKFCALCLSSGKAPNVVASEIGIKSSGTVTGWKNGAVPRLSVLHKLSSYFNVPVEYWTDIDEKKEIPATHMGSEDKETRELYSIIDDYTPDERLELINYAKYIKSKRKDGAV